ncbi:MAG: MauE/DoxX family redox-associated membrane protein [Thermodesulfovibrionales bacterium]
MSMKRKHILYIFSVAARVVLGAVFVYAGFIKLIDPKAFAVSISRYDIVPQILLAPVAIGLPALEFLAGLGLIINIRGSLTVIFSLLFLFVSVLGYGILNNLNIDCGCFSEEDIKGFNSLRIAFYRDLIMIAIASCIYAYRRFTARQIQPHFPAEK